VSRKPPKKILWLRFLGASIVVLLWFVSAVELGTAAHAVKLRTDLKVALSKAVNDMAQAEQYGRRNMEIGLPTDLEEFHKAVAAATSHLQSAQLLTAAIGDLQSEGREAQQLFERDCAKFDIAIEARNRQMKPGPLDKDGRFSSELDDELSSMILETDTALIRDQRSEHRFLWIFRGMCAVLAGTIFFLLWLRKGW
jgi:hypothetical protein